MSQTVKFFKKYGKCIFTTMDKNPYFVKFPPIVCKDGTFISAQAGENYHCYPKENLEDFEYETVEVFKNDDMLEESLMSPFESGCDDYIFDNVPVEIIDVIIEKHGGIDDEKVLKFIEDSNR